MVFVKTIFEITYSKSVLQKEPLWLLFRLHSLVLIPPRVRSSPLLFIYLTLFPLPSRPFLNPYGDGSNQHDGVSIRALRQWQWQWGVGRWRRGLQGEDDNPYGWWETRSGNFWRVATVKWQNHQRSWKGWTGEHQGL